MGAAPQPGNSIRRAVHGIVYGICSGYLGITPPLPEKELRFLGLLVSVLVVLAMAGALFGWYLMQAVFKR
jgi:Sec-independent protein secretion pathway component TatC